MQLPARDERAEAAALNASDPGTISGDVALAIRAANQPRWHCTQAALFKLLEVCRAAAGAAAGVQAAAAAARPAPEPAADAGRAGERRAGR